MTTKSSRTVTRTRARRTTATRTETATPPRAAGADILAWENDPYPQSRPTKPPALAAPIVRPVPNLAAAALGVSIVESRPSPARYNPGSAEFRYWTAAEALRRAADFWAPLLPSGTRWWLGDTLPVHLDAGRDLNAYYDRSR